MRNKDKKPNQGASASPRGTIVILILSILLSSSLGGCDPSGEELEAVEYTPLLGDDWWVSPPAEPGMDPRLSSQMLNDATLQDPLVTHAQSGRIKAN